MAPTPGDRRGDLSPPPGHVALWWPATLPGCRL